MNKRGDKGRGNDFLAAYLLDLGQQSRTAARALSISSTDNKNNALRLMAEALGDAESIILEANERDIEATSGLDDALIDRLKLSPQRISDMVEGVLSVADLPDPVGFVTDLVSRPSGIEVGRMRVPLGVVGVVYESRPNVTADVAALCMKSGNAVILKGGSEAFFSNKVIAEVTSSAIATAGLPKGTVQLVETKDRNAVNRMLNLPEYIDVVIPRGGKGLVELVSKEAKMPVIKHLDGVCHVFLDDSADEEKAHDIALNAKTQRFGTCNTMETLLATPVAAKNIFPRLIESYCSLGVELRGCDRTRKFSSKVLEVSPDDWSTEYLGPILSIKIVDDIDTAINHIADHGSRHTDAIVTEDRKNARDFIRKVDSSSVVINASTRFADGFEYGLGAEIGISTDKFHARGPVGLEGLTSQKWVVIGDGDVRR
jgi:glutamate-5-semialdehyde dehydrogenase